MERENVGERKKDRPTEEGGLYMSDMEEAAIGRLEPSGKAR